MNRLLVCNSLTDGCASPSVIRHCRCGRQLWVTLVMLPTVEAGELDLTCWPCHRATGTPVTLHERTIHTLTAAGRLEEGWQIIGVMNAGLTAANPPSAASRPLSAGWLPAERVAPDARLTAASRSPTVHRA